ncbi:MAG: hypothetical protein J5978_09130 [Spirochaetaceae bacterium]|nr:hypothetical protein [Spirochaetaceae bacterium]
MIFHVFSSCCYFCFCPETNFSKVTFFWASSLKKSIRICQSSFFVHSSVNSEMILSKSAEVLAKIA